MVRKNKRGQAAMEFLMTYGWAILVVLAAIGALAYFGVLSPDNFLPDKCTISPQFYCSEWRVSTDGTVLMEIQNNVGRTVNGSVTLTDAPEGCGTPGATETFAATQNGDFLNGSTSDSQITLDCAASPAFQAGDKAEFEFTISYEADNSNIPRAATGSITTKVE